MLLINYPRHQYRQRITFLGQGFVSYFAIVVLALLLTCVVKAASANGQKQVEKESNINYHKQAAENTLYFDLGLASGWVPYQRSAEPGKPGVYAELMQSISERSNITIRPVHLPPKRAEKALQTGLVDFDFNVLEWMEDGTPGAGFVLSEPLYKVTEYVVTTNEYTALFKQKSDYYGHAIGTIAGYFYYDADKFTRVDFLSEEALIEGLAMGRFKLIIMEEHAAKYWANEHDVDIVLAVQHSKGPVRMRLRQEKAHLLPELNRAISTLKSDGTIRRILASHGIQQEVSLSHKH